MLNQDELELNKIKIVRSYDCKNLSVYYDNDKIVFITNTLLAKKYNDVLMSNTLTKDFMVGFLKQHFNLNVVY